MENRSENGQIIIEFLFLMIIGLVFFSYALSLQKQLRKHKNTYQIKSIP